MADTVLIDINEAKEELSIPHTDAEQDEWVQFVCNAVVSLFEEMTDRKWELATFVEYHNCDKNNNGTIFLKNYPVSSVASVYDDPDWAYGSSALISSDDYSYDPDTGVLKYDGTFNEGFRTVKITYTAGYTAVTVPKWLKQILLRQVAHWHKQKTNQNWDVSSIAAPGGGGTLSYKALENNFLPEFILMIEKHRRVN